jgi:membrane protease YdiL (CAAX protease family)
MNTIIISIVLGIVIGVTEEILWRGVYMRMFPNSIWLNLVYPSVMFALWHLAPQSIVVNRMPGGTLSFVAYALVLGIIYGITVYQTKSIAWSTVAHIVHDTLGLGGFVYAAWLMKLR